MWCLFVMESDNIPDRTLHTHTHTHHLDRLSYWVAVGCWYSTRCRTLRGCVDWNICWPLSPKNPIVAPYVGAWIETSVVALLLTTSWSRTLRGCVDWNKETMETPTFEGGRTLRGCVDWNHRPNILPYGAIESHLTWVRGLKPTSWLANLLPFGRTLRGCVDWNSLLLCNHPW